MDKCPKCCWEGEYMGCMGCPGCMGPICPWCSTPLPGYEPFVESERTYTVADEKFALRELARRKRKNERDIIAKIIAKGLV